MRIPGLFIPEHENLERKTQELLTKKPKRKQESPALKELLHGCETFLKKQEKIEPLEKYHIAKMVANGMRYTKQDIEKLAEKIGDHYRDDFFLGFYLSALINRIITEKDHITLPLDTELSGLGSHLERGKVEVEWSAYSHTGDCMKGGELIIQGDTTSFTACYMTGGLLKTRKMIDYACYFMKGGKAITEQITGIEPGCGMEKKSELWITKNTTRISPNCKGTIYLKNKKIWPKK